jgi:hypothetical protein
MFAKIFKKSPSFFLGDFIHPWRPSRLGGYKKLRVKFISTQKGMTMSDTVETKGAKKRSPLRWLLLVLIFSPFTCCGGFYILSALPGVTPGLFETEARIENRTDETLYLTPITTTYRDPIVIPKIAFIRQVDIPLRPGRSITLTYNAADAVLAGVAVCRKDGECRMSETESSGVTVLDSFAALHKLDPSWRQAMQTSPKYRFGILIYPILGLVPVVLFLNWLYLVWQGKRGAN